MDIKPSLGIYTNLMQRILSWKMMVKTGPDNQTLESVLTEESWLSHNSKKVAGLIPGYPGVCMGSHLCRYSGFLAQSKDMHVTLIGKLIGYRLSARDCLSVALQ